MRIFWKLLFHRNIKSIFNHIKYKTKAYVNNTGLSAEDGLPYWRSKIFNGFILVMFIFSTIAIIPNIIASIQSQSHFITITDSLAYAALFFILLSPRIKVEYKAIMTIIVFYILSLVLLIFLGPMGPGFIWLASVSLIAALFIGLKASVITIVVNMLIIIIIAISIHLKILNTIFFDTYSITTWVAISMNVIIFNSITSIPVALLLNALESSLNNEKSLKESLVIKNKLVLNERNKAQESDKLKSAFLANLSHEIRTPMNAIVGFSELIQLELEKSNVKILHFSNLVSQNANYLLRLITDIVDISLIESGQLTFHSTSFKLGDIVPELEPMIQQSPAQKRNPDTKTRFIIAPKDADTEINTDSIRLKQILINLISNAIKYTNSGNVIVKINIQDRHVKFNVKDAGMGIPECEQKRIFSRFTKIERNNGSNAPGIGLGLSITQGLVKGLGGEIGFVSKENEGSCFYFTIPI